MTMQGEQTPAAVATNAEGSVSFPTGFRWGVATSAYQIEGAVDEDGRGPSIWDTFSHTPGKVTNGDTGDVAVEHYRRYPEDIALMSEIGINAYRFSVSWARIQPDGRSTVNIKGIDYYQQLVDALLERGIDPAITLYHWDLPQPLEDDGGWRARDTAYRFADYAEIVRDALADRVKIWTTLNEPFCSSLLGYSSGIHAPGVEDPAGALRAVHHLLLAHGLAVPRLRSHEGVRQVGLTLNLAPVHSLSQSAEDLDAAARIDILQNRIFLDPVLLGSYPADVRSHIERVSGVDHIQDGDDAIIAAPLDFLGVNYYSPWLVSAGTQQEGPNSWPGAADVQFHNFGGPVTGFGWDIDANGLLSVLLRLHDDYPRLPLMITENGAAFEDQVADDGAVHDVDRTNYIADHLRATHEAISRGVDVRGYFLWSLLDNFEWAVGYSQRFGIVRVDFDNQKRTVKDSGHWYSQVCRSSTVPGRSA